MSLCMQVCIRRSVPAAGAGLQPLWLVCPVPATGETEDSQDSCWKSVYSQLQDPSTLPLCSAVVRISLEY